MKKYKHVMFGDRVNDTVILRVEDNACVPFDPANGDYQIYLKWLAEGNEPLPADVPAQDPVPEQETPAP
jgi:hypothetical protein